MILHIINAKYIDGYKIEVAFNDRRKGTADLSETLHGTMFEPLKDQHVFSQVRVDDTLGTICWQNGADIAPEYVYFQAFKHETELQEQFKKWGYLS